MPITPEDRARETIDRLLTDAGWLIQSRDETNTVAPCGAEFTSRYTNNLFSSREII
jgi:hypothetical protein